jgi:uncharacterized DUF497 family protein
MTVRYRFAWNPEKARSNEAKHGVSFEEARTVLGDALAATLFDDEHSENEERWAPLGRNATGRLLVMVHTFETTREPDVLMVRIISAREPTRRERETYESKQQ